jgi:hypothetical protein
MRREGGKVLQKEEDKQTASRAQDIQCRGMVSIKIVLQHEPAAAERKPPKNPWREIDESEEEEDDDSGSWVAWRAVLLLLLLLLTLLTRDDDCCCCCCWECLRGWRTKALDRDREREARTTRRKAAAEGLPQRGRTMSVLLQVGEGV